MKNQTPPQEALYPIEKGIEYKPKKFRKYPFEDMEVGDSFFMPGIFDGRSGYRARNHRHPDKKFVSQSHKNADGVFGTRIWRIK